MARKMEERSVSYEIRTSWRPGDIGSIIRAHGAIIASECGFDHTFECYVATGLLEFVEDPHPGNRIWLVAERRRVWGSIALHVRSPERAQLRWFWLHPKMRGKGLGRRLLGILVEQARRQALSAIYLWTVAGLEASAHLYREAGFRLLCSEEKPLWGKEICEQRYELDLRKTQ